LFDICLGTPDQAQGFIDELERLKNDRKSKLAGMAEAANLSGNDIMG
jgi:hypothetical protein